MANKVCSRTASVTFWDGYAPWYKLWMEHNRYHNRIIEALTTMVEPGWKVLDIGAGNGVLSSSALRDGLRSNRAWNPRPA